ncbi:amidase [Actinomadura nitritigenes]|uniref:amidase n=1 Tax=Actinomadura nitritigenes TaxID=134602 RepID=UPI003D94A98F
MSRSVSRRLFLARSGAVTAAAALATAPGATPALATTRRLTIPDVPVRPEAAADPTEATLAEAATLLRHRKISAVRLVQAHLDRIAAHDGTYQAFVTVTGEQALAAAKRADRQRGGPLSGIPLCIKDNYFTAGVRTTANSFIFDQFVPGYDATGVARLKNAGGIVIGKGQMGPLATTRATTPDGRITTVNAWTPTDPTVDPGGSSTGPACAVAARMATSSIGTQTGGSIVLPSNQQNLTGLKPTMGRTSIYGVIPLSFTRDHSGPLARDALDAAIMMTVLAGPDPHDVRTLGLPAVPDLVRAATPVRANGKVRLRRTTRIGVPPDYLTGVSAPVLALRKNFLAALEAIPGARTVQVSYPDDWSLLTGAFNDVRLSERTEPFRPWLQKDLKLFGVSVLSWLGGLMLSGDEWITGQRAKTHLLHQVLDGLLNDCDVLLQTGPVPFDILGLPEIGFPIGFDSGVPVGTILGGGPYEEDRLLEVVAAYQAVTDWHWRRPADPPQSKLRTLAARPRIDAVSAARQSA